MVTEKGTVGTRRDQRKRKAAGPDRKRQPVERIVPRCALPTGAAVAHQNAQKRGKGAQLIGL